MAGGDTFEEPVPYLSPIQGRNAKEEMLVPAQAPRREPRQGRRESGLGRHGASRVKEKRA